MRKPKVPDAAPGEEQPQRGGSYLRDPDTGKLTPRDNDAGTDVDVAADSAGEAGADSNLGADASDGAAPTDTDQEG